MRDCELYRRIQGGHCIVLGYGISNRPLVRWLRQHGAARLSVRDMRLLSSLPPEEQAALDEMGVSYIGGETYLAGLDEAVRTAAGDGMPTVIFRTPGMRPDGEAILAALNAGAVLSSEMELFFALTEATVLGITGSDGKTTTTTITSLLVQQALTTTGCGRMYLGGNIGAPLLPMVEQMTPEDVAVVELSSFQLMTMTCSPYRAAVTNLSPNHLNWHTDMDEYVTAKTNILTHGAAGAVLNRENDLTVALGLSLPDDLPITWFSSTRVGREAVVPSERLERGCGDIAVYERGGVILRETSEGSALLLDVSRIRLPGRHNLENYMTALAMTDGWVTPAVAGAVADSFTGVEHRLELVREVHDIRFYNSSIDSSPTRTAAALSALRDMNERALAAGQPARRLPVVICGGRDKHLDMAPLAEALCRDASAVVLTGEARELILSALEACPLFHPADLPVTVIPDWGAAIGAALDMVHPGDTLLLSPACTSFDAFKNFEERGRFFKNLVLHKAF